MFCLYRNINCHVFATVRGTLLYPPDKPHGGHKTVLYQTSCSILDRYWKERVRNLPGPEILLWATHEAPPRALQTSECSELLNPTRTSYVILVQRQPGKLAKVRRDGVHPPGISLVTLCLFILGESIIVLHSLGTQNKSLLLLSIEASAPARGSEDLACKLEGDLPIIIAL